MNLPTDLYVKVKGLIGSRKELSYRSITEFVAETVRKRMGEIEMTYNLKLLFESTLFSKTKEET